MPLDSSMKLEKLTIYIEKKPFKPVEVLFNPNEIRITKTAWTSKGNEGLVPSDDPRTLSLTLFFDTSLPKSGEGSMATTLPQAVLNRTSVQQRSQPDDVRAYTRQIMELTKPQNNFGRQLRPPICDLQWGQQMQGGRNEAVFFRGVLKSVTQTFSRFLHNGIPIRATLNCDFEEWEAPEYRERAQNPIDDPIRIVKRGETLTSIAYEEYGDSALWRIIANENKLTDPRGIFPGQQLTVPPLRPNILDRRSR